MSIKKGWKITWISLGSLLGLVVIVLAVAMWMVFTPSKLTKIVNSLSDRFITCEASFGNVDLTLLSTFPDAGLRIDNVVIVNPMKGAPNDTLARIGSLTVGIDVKAFIKENKVIVHQVRLDDATANLYIDRDGKANFDIFPPSEKKEEDTTGATLPGLIDLKKIKVSNLNASFIDEKDGMDASIAHLDMALKGTMSDKDIDADLDLESRQIRFTMTDSTGVDKLAAALTDLKFDGDGSMKGDDLKADLDLRGGRVELTMRDSTGVDKMVAALNGMGLGLDAKGSMPQMAGLLKLKVEDGRLKVGENEMVNDRLQASTEELLEMEVPFKANIVNGEWRVESGKLKIDDYGLAASGEVLLATAARPMTVDVALSTDGAWQVKPLLEIVPEAYTGFAKGMELDGRVALEATAKGPLTDTTMPVVDAKVELARGLFHSPSMLPYRIEKISGNLAAHLDLGKGGKSSARINRLKARTRDTEISLTGRADDLTGDMHVDATLQGSLPLEDAMPLIPQRLKLAAKGNADLDLHANFKMSQLKQQAFDKMKASGTLKMSKVDVIFDTLHATAPTLDIALQVPSREHGGLMADARITSGELKVESGKMRVELENADIGMGVNNLLKQQPLASVNIQIGESEASIDSTMLSFGGLKLKGSVRLDSTQQNLLLQYNPRFEVSTHSAVLYAPTLPDAVRLSELEVDYKPNLCDIKQVQVRLGHSDFSLYGMVKNIEDWLGKKTMLKGDLNLTSSYADVDQMMDIFSGMGSDKDSLAQMRKEDSVPADANPFIVPKDVDITLYTHIQRSVAFGNDLNDVAGSLTIKDGVAVLDQIGFVCKAATMQLTALYRSPRPGNLFTALDFHLLDIQIHELLEMIPAVDTLVPMLSAFDGNANFHLAGETYLDARYRPKMSSIMGAAAITGENLVVMDNKSISNIAKLMKFKSWKDKDDKIKIDSMSVELTCMDVGFGTEVEVLPFLLNVGSYQICASGVQSLGSDCSYHLELLKNPLLVKVGVDVKGTLANPKISLGKVMYSDLFKPKKQGVAEKKALEIKSKVRKALEANVR